MSLRSVFYLTFVVLSIAMQQDLGRQTRLTLQQSADGADGRRSKIPSYDEYLRVFGRSLTKDSPEYRVRRDLYEKRAVSILSKNERGASWRAGFNQFTDKTEAELRSFHGWSRSGGGSDSRRARGTSLLESTGEQPLLLGDVDWTTARNPLKRQIKVLKVVDQDSCGSCWAFATVAMLNAHHEILTGSSDVEFSPQELVDCVDNPKNCGGTGGCDGATVELALDYVSNVSFGKLRTLQEYKYTGLTGSCQPHHDMPSIRQDHGLVLSGFHTLPENSAKSLMRALGSGPVAVSVGANDDWFWYEDGIFSECSKDAVINHAVLMVGYGDGYWKIQNSWGSNWGKDGYMLLQRKGPQLDSAHCGIDNKPQDGVACEPYPDQVTVCGMCGILYDSVSVNILDTRSKKK